MQIAKRNVKKVEKIKNFKYMYIYKFEKNFKKNFDKKSQKAFFIKLFTFFFK